MPMLIGVDAAIATIVIGTQFKLVSSFGVTPSFGMGFCVGVAVVGVGVGLLVGVGVGVGV
jgi:hypothetical protein